MILPVDINKVVTDLKQHFNAAVHASFLERWPVEFFEHGIYTASPVKVACYESCCTSLNLLNLLCVPLCVSVPNGAGIFNCWSDKCSVDSLFDLMSTVTKVA